MAIRDIEQRQVEEQFRDKLRLEKQFRPKIVRLFKKINKGVTATLANTGRVGKVDKYRGELVSLLRAHYEKVQTKFKGVVTSTQKQEDEDEDLIAAFDLGLTTWAEENSERSADLILGTTENNIQDSVNKARSILEGDGEEVTNRTLAAAMRPVLDRELAGRVEGIISFETQAPAESTKLFEAFMLSGLVPPILEVPPSSIPGDPTKVWITVGDNRVRDIHKKVEAQVRKLMEPFNAGGEKLMQPGDTSLGASAGNVINCRCGASYRV